MKQFPPLAFSLSHIFFSILVLLLHCHLVFTSSDIIKGGKNYSKTCEYFLFCLFACFLKYTCVY